MLNREHEAALDWCGRAVGLARRFGDRERELASMSTGATARMFVDYDAGRAEGEAVLQVARAESQHGVTASMLMNLGSAAGELMRLAPAREALGEAIAFSIEHEMDGNLHYASAWMALCDLRAGDWGAAAERAGEVIERTVSFSISRVMALVALGTLRTLRGDPGAAPLLDEALALAGSSDTLQRVAPVRAMRAEAAWLRGDLAACDAEARAGLALAETRRHPWFIGELAAWCWRAGTLHEAPAHCAEPHALEIAGRWREAADAWGRLGCRYARARALAEGDAAAANDALAELDALGARPVAEALRRRLRDAGVRGVARGARASTRGHPCGLTAAEMRVLALMAEELRNADIAARLHRSVRTVDHHVAAVLAKLEVTSRLEAVRRAEREGWLGAAAPAQSGQRARPG
jgi:DNA-binding CsgD family transcriptional regulator